MRKLPLILTSLLLLACGDDSGGSGDDGTGTESDTGTGGDDGGTQDDGGETGSATADGDGAGTTGGDDDGTGDAGSGDTGTTGGDATGTDDTGGTTGSVDCDRNGWESDYEEGLEYTADAYLLYYGEVGNNPYDSLYVEYFLDFGASDQPGSHQFVDQNYAGCHTCAVIYADCDQQDNCSKKFLAISGTLETTAIGIIGDQLAATLTDVVLVEVEIDEATYNSTKVPGGEGWCIEDFSFDVTIMSGS